MTKIDNSIIDLTLTAMNAKQKRYQYIDDVFYDGSAASRDIVELLQEHNYKLGTPSKQSNLESYYGFYAPIKDK